MTWIITLVASGMLAFAANASEQIYFSLFSEPLPNDDFRIFLDGQTYVSNIFLLQNKRLTQGQANFDMWAGSYWPIHQGLLGLRFADPDFPRSKIFAENYSNFLSRPPDFLILSNQVNRLSPSEKYDLLIGDKNWTLTKAMWARGLNIQELDGSVPTWMGICHGWAAAVHMGVKAPQQSVVVTDVTGQYTIEFYKQDIKALMSYLWAESSTDSVKAGNRCRQDVVIKDPYLRPIDPACLDSNPMSWHLAITNKIGLYKKSFAIDSESGSEVWNFPIQSYDYSYFNPRTFEPTHNLKAAIEPITNLTADKYRPYRSLKTRYIVGIVMDAFTPSMVSPQIRDVSNDRTKANTFIYDLELDENYNVIGGEWYSANHPDFIWSYASEGKAMNREDQSLAETWDIESRIPENYANKAIEASGRAKVLSKISETLLNASLGWR